MNYLLKSLLSMISLLFFCLTCYPPVFASGLLMYEQGDPAIGTAAVGQTVADDASSAYSNPAGMVGLDRSEVLLGSQLLLMNAKFKTDPDVQNPYVGSDGGDAVMILPGGGFYYAQKFYKNRVAAGLALNAPMGLGLDYEEGWKGRYLVQDTLLLCIIFAGAIRNSLCIFANICGVMTTLLENGVPVSRVMDAVKGPLLIDLGKERKP